MRRWVTMTLMVVGIVSTLLAGPDDASAWADSVYLGMSWEEKVGQIFMVPFVDEPTAQQSIELFNVAGFILPSGTPEEISHKVAFLKSKAKYPLWIALEAMEGTNPHLITSQQLPAAGTLQSLTNTELLEQIGFATGEILAALGINLHVMPVNLPAYTSGMMKAGVTVLTAQNLSSGQVNPIKDRSMAPITYSKYIRARSESDMVVTALTVKQSVDLIIFDEGQMDELEDIQIAVFDNLKKKEIKDVTKKILEYKWPLRTPHYFSSGHLETLLQRDLATLLYHTLAHSLVYEPRGTKKKLPIEQLGNNYFAVITFDTPRGRKFTEGVQRYVLADQFTLDPQNGLTDRQMANLARFDWVMVDLSAADVSQKVWQQMAGIASKTELVVYLNATKNAVVELPKGHIVWNSEPAALAYDLASQAIFGAIPMTGQWPESFKNNKSVSTSALNRLRYSYAEMVGLNSGKLAEIDAIAEEAIKKKAMPGAQVLIVKNGAVVFDKQYGHHTYDSLMPVQKSSIYDVASLTKVIGTLQAIMYLADQGKVDVNARLEQHFPELIGNPKGKVIIRDILAHQAGFPSYYPFWRNTFDRKNGLLPDFYAPELDDKYRKSVTAGLYTTESMEDSLWHWIMSDKIKLKPAGKYLYSDIGFMILKRLAEKELGEPLDYFLKEKIHRPLGMYHTSYSPLCDFPLDQVVPTEEDKEFRMSIVLGHVHDHNAAMIGGVAGHAGMFSTANDIAKIMQMHIQGGQYGGKQYFSASLTKSFTQVQNNYNRRGLGWDKPSYDPVHNNVSNKAAPSTFGHTGFTGVAAWADPDHNLVYIFLSNRTFPNSNNNKLNELKIRNRIHDTIYSAIVPENNTSN